ncbi:MAG: DNA polymerase III subunit delta' [Candidatus Stahlbacteria bacterium]|nr:MAG: DNA polymerase III subunit delta' [Candidatus Stahlbacteria bacterium]
MAQVNQAVLGMLKGQPHAVEFLEKAAENPQGGYIFFGPDGVGKRTAAILFAAAINPPSFSETIFSLSHPDIAPLFPFRAEPASGREKWIEELGQERENYMLDKLSPDPNPSWVISIDRIRDLRREMKYPPRILHHRAALLFDFDRIREEGANAFLKTLEEPQAQTVLVLTTSRPFALPATIRSRCKLVRFKALEDEVIKDKLLNDGHPEEEVDVAVDVAFGSLKQAYLYLDDKESLISEEVFSYLEHPASSDLDLVRLIERLSYQVGLDKILSSFSLVFRWVMRARSGRRPSWKRLAKLVGTLSARISRAALVHNILATERMSGRVALNPTPSLFLYQYLSSLRFD